MTLSQQAQLDALRDAAEPEFGPTLAVRIVFMFYAVRRARGRDDLANRLVVLDRREEVAACPS